MTLFNRVLGRIEQRLGYEVLTSITLVRRSLVFFGGEANGINLKFVFFAAKRHWDDPELSNLRLAVTCIERGLLGLRTELVLLGHFF